VRLGRDFIAATAFRHDSMVRAALRAGMMSVVSAEVADRLVSIWVVADKPCSPRAGNTAVLYRMPGTGHDVNPLISLI
jgi:hypothetical protein